MTDDAMERLRKIEPADTRRYKADRRKMRAVLRDVADDRGGVTIDLHHLAENAGLSWPDARWAIRDMELRGELQVFRFPEDYGSGLIRLRPYRTGNKRGKRV